MHLNELWNVPYTQICFKMSTAKTKDTQQFQKYNIIVKGKYAILVVKHSIKPEKSKVLEIT